MADNYISLKKFGEVHIENIDDDNKKSAKETVYLHNFMIDTVDNKSYVVPWGRLERIKYSIKNKKETFKGTNFNLFQMKLLPEDTVKFCNDSFIITKINNIPIKFQANINSVGNIDAKYIET